VLQCFEDAHKGRMTITNTAR